jgi:hypothetical protein
MDCCHSSAGLLLARFGSGRGLNGIADHEWSLYVCGRHCEMQCSFQLYCTEETEEEEGEEEEEEEEEQEYQELQREWKTRNVGGQSKYMKERDLLTRSDANPMKPHRRKPRQSPQESSLHSSPNYRVGGSEARIRRIGEPEIHAWIT